MFSSRSTPRFLQRHLILSFQQDLAQIPYGPDKAEGIEEGQDVAAEILALRSNDGSAAILPPFVPESPTGKLSTDAPQLRASGFHPVATGHSFCLLARANEFRPGPPPQLTSEEYTPLL